MAAYCFDRKILLFKLVSESSWSCFHLLQTFQIGQVPFQMTADVPAYRRMFEMMNYATS